MEGNLTDIIAALINRDGNGGGFGGDSGAWVILFLIVLFGGFGGYNRGPGGYGGGAGNVGGNELYPWLNQSEQIGTGFQMQALGSAVTSLQGSVIGGFADVQHALCSGFAGVNAGIAGGFAQTQMGMMQGFADSQLATANQTAAMLAEHCADRNALAMATRDIIDSNNVGFQRVMDRLADQELQAERRENEQLRQQLAMAQLAASQTAQTAQLIADNAAQTRILNPTPIPAYVVTAPTPTASAA